MTTPTPPPDDEACAGILRGLGDPTRLAVLRQLLDGPRCVGDINGVLSMEPTLLSHHLRVLRERKLVEARRRGKEVEYRLAPGLLRSRRSGSLDFGCCRISLR